MQGIVSLGINERLTLRGVLGKAASQCLSNISEECVCVCVCFFLELGQERESCGAINP